MSELLTYIKSANDLDANAVYALPYETLRLEKQLQAIGLSQGEIAGHISDAMEQSSETWHDNAPADALFGEMFQLDKRHADLVRAARRLIKVSYPTDEVAFATIGSRVLCSIGKGEKFHLDIVGNLPLSEEEEDHDEVERGSISAPMPRALLGVKIGETVAVDLPGRILEVSVANIDQAAQRLAYD